MKARNYTKQQFYRTLLQADPNGIGTNLHLASVAAALDVDVAVLSRHLSMAEIAGWVKKERRLGTMWIQILDRPALEAAAGEGVRA